MLLKKYKVINGIRFIKCWYSKVRANRGRVCSFCKFYDIKTDKQLCATEFFSLEKRIDFIDICAKSISYDNTIRNPRLINFTTYIPDQEIYYLDDETGKIKKIEKT
jgi:hypothetical protein